MYWKPAALPALCIVRFKEWHKFRVEKRQSWEMAFMVSSDVTKMALPLYCRMCCTLCFANLHTLSYHIKIQHKNCACIFRYIQASGPNQWYVIYISGLSLPGLCVCLQCKSFTPATNSQKKYENGPLLITQAWHMVSVQWAISFG